MSALVRLLISEIMLPPCPRMQPTLLDGTRSLVVIVPSSEAADVLI